MNIEMNTSGTRTGRSRNRNPDYDLSNCSHIYHDLHPLIDTQYLDPEYVKRKNYEEKAILPTKCTLCSMKIIPFKNNILLLITKKNHYTIFSSLITVFCI